MNKVLCVVILAFTACASPQRPERSEEHEAALASVRAALDAGDYDAALAQTDQLIAANPNDRDARLLAAQGNIALFESGRSGQQFFLADAITNLEQASSIGPPDPGGLIALSRLYLKDSRFEEGRSVAIQAAAILRNSKASQEEICTAILAAVDNEMQLFVNARRPEIAAGADPAKPTSDLANAVLQHLEYAKRGLPGPAYLKSGQIYQWLGQERLAIDEYERGIIAVPADADLHEAFQNAYQSMDRRPECIAAYRRLMEAGGDSTILTWYLGRALVAYADDQRLRGQTDAAAKTYSQAAETFRHYLSKMRTHAAATNHWLAICYISLGRLALDAGEFDQARQYYDRAYDATDRVAQSDDSGQPVIVDVTGHHYLAGIDLLGQLLSEGGERSDFEAALRHYEEMIARHPGQFGFLYNNAAFTARELGVAIAKSVEAPNITAADRQERLAHASALWEKSYALYQKAVELSPEDARIVNDCGLMLVYHLHRDYDKARELFDRAIAVGQPRIDALPTNASKDERNLAEEAVGDAYQNIGVMMNQQGRPFAEYESFLDKSLEYYPYQGRQEVTQLLRDQRRQHSGGGANAGGGQDPQPDAKASAFAPIAAAATGKANADDYDGALLVLDQAASQFKDYAPYHALFGVYSLRYAGQARAQGGNVGQIDGLYADAISHLDRAIAIDGAAIDVQLQLATAYAETGEFEKATATATKLLRQLQSGGDVDPENLAAAHAVRANAATRVYIQGVQSGTESESLEQPLQRARSSFRELENAGSIEAGQLSMWVMLEQWAKNTDQAVAVLTRAYQRNPTDQNLLSQLVDVGAQAGASDKIAALLQQRDDPTTLWYLGKAQFNNAVDRWTGGESKSALAQLDAAVASFGSSKAQNASFTESCDQWIAFSLGQKGLVLIGQERFAEAETTLLSAARTSPAQATADLGGGNSIKRGLLIVADHYLQRGDLGKCEQVYAAASMALPQDSDLANNHGLLARDYGTKLERAGKHAKAEAMFEASYAAYSQAAANEPDSIRLVNDRALLLIYHLERDWELSLQLLTRAATQGEQQLRDDPPDDKQELRDLQEALGDVYQNLGYYYEKHLADLTTAVKWYNKSLSYYPFKRRESSRHLARVEKAIAKRAAKRGENKDGNDDKGGRVK